MKMVIMVLFVLCSTLARGEDGSPVDPNKKLIAFAADVVHPSYLKRFIADLEKLPLDGIVITVHPDASVFDKKMGIGDTGFGDKIGPATIGRNALWFGGHAFNRNDFQEAIADLKATRFQRFTDNFMEFNTGGDIRGLGVPDWFSDEWSRVAENGAVAAYVAKEGGLKGLFLDTEMYSGGTPSPWRHPYSYTEYSESYSGKPPHSIAECITQVRKRGKEFTQAITAVYPEITIVMMHDTGWSGEDEYKLLAPFVDGMLEGLGDNATLIDGGERGYSLQIYSDFANLRKNAENGGRARSRVPDLLKKKMQYGFGVWIDCSAVEYGGWHTNPKDWDRNHKSPNRLEHTLYNALSASDRYVWLFAIHPQYWWNPHLRQPEHVQEQMKFSPSWQCQLCPHAEIPQAYLDALRNCRKPHDLNWLPAIRGNRFFYFDAVVLVEGTAISKKKPNLLKNSGFENWSAGENKPPDGWDPPGGQVSRESVQVKEGLYSARLTSALPSGHLYLQQVFEAGPMAGKTFTFGAWFKTEFKERMGGSLALVYDDGDGTWHHLKLVEYTGKGDWQFLTGTATVPKDASNLVRFMFDISFSP